MSSSHDPSAGEGRFLPGEILAERYRIVSLIGAGGMGEVYRATDLKLGQPVALKFLSLTATPAAIQRFRGEVRIARQISHPNVCRVYDIAEIDGQTFLSMEYVDGEDLASLLRRIGRLPEDKAIDIARQICAGLAAAHERGVLHRDLKPANILLDGRGVARVADFGLAAAEEIRAGTPAYMAPEQLAGREVTTRSDIYSLGLVLFELFTGKRALDAPGSSPSAPSTLVRDIDPAVERVLLQCLETDPADRPASALAISARLPGGDPLAAALAAGETPSPALVAAAGEQAGIAPWHAAVLYAAILAGLAAVWVARSYVGQWNHAGLEKPPVVLADRARSVLSAMGYTARPGDAAWGFQYNNGYLQFQRRHTDVRFPPISFWYRESPGALVNVNPIASGVTVGAVTAYSPPPLVPGMATVWLDPAGRLLVATVYPPENRETAEPYDWSRILPLTGLDVSKLQPTSALFNPSVGFDQRAAWTGTVPEYANAPVRIEAAALNGKLVQFQTIMPWMTPSRVRSDAAPNFRELFSAALVSAVVLSGVFLARRNLRLGRGDRRGAFRVAAATFLLHFAGFAFGADHVLQVAELDLLAVGIAMGLFKAAMLWLGYIALEPVVRRRLPHGLVSWTRLTAGQWRDPVVGRDILLGMLAGVGAHLFWSVESAVRLRLNGGYLLVSNAIEAIAGFSSTVALIPNEGTEALLQAFALFLIYFFFRLVGRRDWIAVVLASVLLMLQSSAMYSPSLWVSIPLSVAAYGLVFSAAVRVGLTGVVAAMLVADLLFAAPVTLDFSLWYAPWAALMYAVLAAVALVAFRVALAGRPVLR